MKNTEIKCERKGNKIDIYVQDERVKRVIRIFGAWIETYKGEYSSKIIKIGNDYYVYIILGDSYIRSLPYSTKKMAKLAEAHLYKEMPIVILPPENILMELICKKVEIIYCDKKDFFFLNVYKVINNKKINIEKIGKYKTLAEAQKAKKELEEEL